MFSWLYYIPLCLVIGAMSVLYPEEYCRGETFTPTCECNEVVIIQQARYGRMRLGRCVKQDLGYLGCQEDVMPYVKEACSGKHTCNFLVFSQNMGSMEPCLELRSYLEVQYNCLQVITKGRIHCTSSGSLLLSQTQGYISSSVARDRGCGSMKAPWRIEAEPGKSINVSLINYTPQKQDRGGRCEPLGYIYDVPQNNNVTICNSAEAQQHVYVSISHIVEIQLITDTIEEHNLLLQYSVVGCKDLNISPFMWYQRDGITVTVGYKANKVSWSLRCEGTQWVGVIGNYTQEDDKGTLDTDWGIFSDTYMVALIVVISLGVVLFIVTVLCVYCVWKTILHKRSQQQQQVERNFYYTDSIQPVHALPATQSSLPFTDLLQSQNDGYETYDDRKYDELLRQQAEQERYEEPEYFTL